MNPTYVVCDHASRCGGGYHLAEWSAAPVNTDSPNTFTNKAEIQYLREGDRILVQENGTNTFRIAVTTMDGHAVSADYGVRTGNDYFTKNKEKDYINVHFDGVTYPIKKGGHSGYLHPNESIYQRDVTVYVTRAVAKRITADKRTNADARRLENVNGQITAAEQTRAAAVLKIIDADIRLATLKAEKEKLENP